MGARFLYRLLDLLPHLGGGLTMLTDIDVARWTPVVTGLLLVLTLASLGVSIWTFRSARKMSIQLANLLELRDLSIRNSLLARLGLDQRAEVLQVINDAFAEGTMVWQKEYLPELLGEEEANKILNARVDFLATQDLR